jgi:aconitate hydratase
VLGIASGLAAGKVLDVRATAADGTVKNIKARARIDTAVELSYYQHGGILQFVLRQLLKS